MLIWIIRIAGFASILGGSLLFDRFMVRRLHLVERDVRRWRRDIVLPFLACLAFALGIWDLWREDWIWAILLFACGLGFLWPMVASKLREDGSISNRPET